MASASARPIALYDMNAALGRSRVNHRPGGRGQQQKSDDRDACM